METVMDLMKQVESFSDLVADAVIKRTSPVKDDLSERQACAAYGTRWLRDKRKQGLADAHRIGGKLIYSRHQLDCIRAAERLHAKLIFQTNK